MFRSRPTRPKHPIGENPVLRRRYEEEHELPDRKLERRYNFAPWQADLRLDYWNWLRDHGIDPATGRMTEEGVAFLKECLDRERLSKPPRGRKKARSFPP